MVSEEACLLDAVLDDDNYLTTKQATNLTKTQPGEHLNCPLFEWEEYLKDNRPMLELKAGSNVWYLATIIGESKTEIKVDFPATNKTPHVQEWISKRSSRIWRGRMGGSAWRYIKGSDGGWAPKTGTESTHTGSKQRGGTQQKQRSRRSGGNGHRKDDTPTATGTANSAHAHFLSEAAMDTAASPQQPRSAKPVYSNVAPPVLVESSGAIQSKQRQQNLASAYLAHVDSLTQNRAAGLVVSANEDMLNNQDAGWQGKEGFVSEAQDVTAVADLPVAASANIDRDPLAEWFLSHFQRLGDVSCKSNSRALVISVEGGVGIDLPAIKPVSENAATEGVNLHVPGSLSDGEQQWTAYCNEDKACSGPCARQGQQTGTNVSKEVRRLQQWEWDKQAATEGYSSMSDEDSMIGSRENSPSDVLNKQEQSPGDTQPQQQMGHAAVAACQKQPAPTVVLQKTWENKYNKVVAHDSKRDKILLQARSKPAQRLSPQDSAGTALALASSQKVMSAAMPMQSSDTGRQGRNASQPDRVARPSKQLHEERSAGKALTSEQRREVQRHTLQGLCCTEKESKSHSWMTNAIEGVMEGNLGLSLDTDPGARQIESSRCSAIQARSGEQPLLSGQELDAWECRGVSGKTLPASHQRIDVGLREAPPGLSSAHCALPNKRKWEAGGQGPRIDIAVNGSRGPPPGAVKGLLHNGTRCQTLSGEWRGQGGATPIDQHKAHWHRSKKRT